MSNLVAQSRNLDAVESALVKNDISKLSDVERINYYNAVCESVGLNPLTKPFAYLVLNGKTVLYATKDCTEQLRKIHRVSTQIISKGVNGDFVECHVRAKDATGREDEDFAAIPLSGAKGSDLANMIMKCVTKAKRRVTLSICGLGMLDESELDTITTEAKGVTSNPQVRSVFEENPTTGRLEIKDSAPERTAEAIIDDTPQDLGSFVCKIGKKFSGKMLSELDAFELDNYVKWLKDSAEKQNKTLTGDFLEFTEVAEAYLCSLEVKA